MRFDDNLDPVIRILRSDSRKEKKKFVLSVIKKKKKLLFLLVFFKSCLCKNIQPQGEISSFFFGAIGDLRMGHEKIFANHIIRKTAISLLPHRLPLLSHFKQQQFFPLRFFGDSPLPKSLLIPFLSFILINTTEPY